MNGTYIPTKPDTHYLSSLGSLSGPSRSDIASTGEALLAEFTLPIDAWGERVRAPEMHDRALQHLNTLSHIELTKLARSFGNQVAEVQLHDGVQVIIGNVFYSMQNRIFDILNLAFSSDATNAELAAILISYEKSCSEEMAGFFHGSSIVNRTVWTISNSLKTSSHNLLYKTASRKLIRKFFEEMEFNTNGSMQVLYSLVDIIEKYADRPRKKRDALPQIVSC